MGNGYGGISAKYAQIEGSGDLEDPRKCTKCPYRKTEKAVHLARVHIDMGNYRT